MKIEKISFCKNLSADDTLRLAEKLESLETRRLKIGHLRMYLATMSCRMWLVVDVRVPFQGVGFSASARTTSALVTFCIVSSTGGLW